MVRVGLAGAACRIYWASISVGRVWRDSISWKQQPNPLESARVTRLGKERAMALVMRNRKEGNGRLFLKL